MAVPARQSAAPDGFEDSLRGAFAGYDDKAALSVPSPATQCPVET